MHVPLMPRRLFLHPTPCWASCACCPRVAHPIYNAQTRSYDDGACINGQNGDLGGNIPVLSVFRQCQLLELIRHTPGHPWPGRSVGL